MFHRNQKVVTHNFIIEPVISTLVVVFIKKLFQILRQYYIQTSLITSQLHHIWCLFLSCQPLRAFLPAFSAYFGMGLIIIHIIYVIPF